MTQPANKSINQLITVLEQYSCIKYLHIQKLCFQAGISFGEKFSKKKRNKVTLIEHQYAVA